MKKEAFVARGELGQEAHNTLAVFALDLVVPLEMDLDDDPQQDDEVRLRSADGTYEQHLLSSDEAVHRDGDHPILLYRFKDVPLGTYTIAVRIADTWYDVLTGLRVTRAGVFHGTQSLEAPHEGAALGHPEDDDPEEEIAELDYEFVDHDVPPEEAD